MILRQQSEQIEFDCEDARYIFLKSGDIREFTNGPFMLNQFVGNPLDGSLNNIYLKIFEPQLKVYPLLGRTSKSRVYQCGDGLVYEGTAGAVAYSVTFTFAPGGIWFWHVTLHGHGECVQLIYGQDVGVADKNAVRTNELYMSQYLDHFIHEGDMGYTVCSRQNQNQGGRFPYLQQGCLDRKIIGYCTDAMQFYGKSYRKTNRIEALYHEPLKEKYQFELSYIGLWTEVFALDSPRQTTFYGIFKPTMETPVRTALYMEAIHEAYASISNTDAHTRGSSLACGKDCGCKKALSPVELSAEFAGPYCSPEISGPELDAWFPSRILGEYHKGRLISFFKEDHTHVVLQEKELLVERPHGNIITTLPEDRKIRKDLMTSTNFMYGLFHGQVAMGNTDSNRLLCANRGLLNILKYTGQRIYVKIDGQYHILTLPAVYETALNYSRWYYKIDDDLLIITADAMAETPVMGLHGRSVKGRSYDFIITSQLSMGGAEFNEPIKAEIDGVEVILSPVEDSGICQVYPKLQYRMVFPEGAHISDDRIFYTDDTPRNGTLLCAAFSGSSFSLTISGTLDGNWPERTHCSTEMELERYTAFYEAFRRGLTLGFDREVHVSASQRQAVEKLNVLTTWYIHNAFVHFYTPRGLEQCSGAAWGTRDVCQGPMELFLTTAHFELARETLLEVFAHQNIDTMEWPQWFMFDHYPYMAGDCHGDVVFWPLKCLGDYLEATEDFAILKEDIPYRHNDGTVTSPETVTAHVILALEAIRQRFTGGMDLISYAGGDWDDTLQPADPAMKERLISAWTQALAYQTLSRLGTQLELSGDAALGARVVALAERIGDAFKQYLICDGVIAGFGCLGDDGRLSYMLHPRDENTGIHYRLLPLTRSIISGLVSKDQAQANIKIIDEHLNFPDGVRLMDRPARYDGGVSHYFQRAEQAANVGREISLQYVHAHIRYIEAMAVYGDGERVFDSLMKIIPINIKDAVGHGALRQSNAYFSSSEGDFKDRYEYAEKFEQLKTGEIPVKGGWRIYSSGPGIFLGRLIGNMLGIREKAHGLEIDPVLPAKLDGLTLDYECYGKRICFTYHVGARGAGVSEILCDGKQIPMSVTANPYRDGGTVIGKGPWMEATKNCSQVHVFLK